MPRKVLSGLVVSAKMDKTVSVLVQRRFTSPLYKKTVRKAKKYHAHDPKGLFKEGDSVRILEHPPISKTKRWLVVYDSTSSN
jgi:small subunit ribosomal protein S17